MLAMPPGCGVHDMRLLVAAYGLGLSAALSVLLLSLFSASPDAGLVRLVAIACIVVMTAGLVHNLRRLP